MFLAGWDVNVLPALATDIVLASCADATCAQRQGFYIGASWVTRLHPENRSVYPPPAPWTAWFDAELRAKGFVGAQHVTNASLVFLGARNLTVASGPLSDTVVAMATAANTQVDVGAGDDVLLVYGQGAGTTHYHELGLGNDVATYVRNLSHVCDAGCACGCVGGCHRWASRLVVHR